MAEVSLPFRRRRRQEMLGMGLKFCATAALLVLLVVERSRVPVKRTELTYWDGSASDTPGFVSEFLMQLLQMHNNFPAIDILAFDCFSKRKIWGLVLVVDSGLSQADSTKKRRSKCVQESQETT
jgi:hypothetical protein